MRCQHFDLRLKYYVSASNQQLLGAIYLPLSVSLAAGSIFVVREIAFPCYRCCQWTSWRIFLQWHRLNSTGN